MYLIVRVLSRDKREEMSNINSQPDRVSSRFVGVAFSNRPVWYRRKTRVFERPHNKIMIMMKSLVHHRIQSSGVVLTV